jgi:uncharacterized phage infection (PIP) family protein YhgE
MKSMDQELLAALSEMLDRKLDEKLEPVNEKLAALETGQLEINDRLTVFESGQLENNDKLSDLITGQRALEAGQHSLEKGQQGIEATVKEIRAINRLTHKKLFAQLDEMWKDIKATEHRVDRQEKGAAM